MPWEYDTVLLFIWESLFGANISLHVRLINTHLALCLDLSNIYITYPYCLRLSPIPKTNHTHASEDRLGPEGRYVRKYRLGEYAGLDYSGGDIVVRTSEDGRPGREFPADMEIHSVRPLNLR